MEKKIKILLVVFPLLLLLWFTFIQVREKLLPRLGVGEVIEALGVKVSNPETYSSWNEEEREKIRKNILQEARNISVEKKAEIFLSFFDLDRKDITFLHLISSTLPQETLKKLVADMTLVVRETYRTMSPGEKEKFHYLITSPSSTEIISKGTSAFLSKLTPRERALLYPLIRELTQIIEEAYQNEKKI